MKKLGILLLIAAMALVFVSCSDHVHSFKVIKAASCIEDGIQECEECGEQVVIPHGNAHVDANNDGICDVCMYSASDNAIAVLTFEDLVSSINLAKAVGCNAIIVKADIAWDVTALGDAGTFEPVVTGLTIDLGGKTLANVPKNALNLKGENFTIKNGTILATADNNRYSLCINYNDTNGLKEEAEAKIPASYTENDTVWAKRIIVDGINATAALIGYSTAEVKNCNFTGGQYRGLVMQGTSGVIQDTTICTLETAGSAGVVAHSYGVVTFKGTVSAKGKFGLYAAGSGKAVVAEGATLTLEAYQTYGAYIETSGEATFGVGTTIGTANGSHVYMNAGKLTLNNGVSLKDKTGTATEKLVVAEKKDSENTIIDNRVCSHDAKVHSEAKAANCGVAGNVENWYCSSCEKYFSDEACTTEIPAANVTIAASGAHTAVHHAAVAPVGTTDGNIEYWTCSVCEKYFTDEACTTETTAADVVVMAHSSTNHSYVEGVCSVCGYKSADSKFHVSSFAQFVESFNYAGTGDGKCGTEIVLDSDIAWVDEVADSIARDVTGLTIDLGTHTLSNVAGGGKLNLQGNSFTLKNGTIAARDGAVYSVLTINDKSSNAAYADDVSASMPAKYDDTDAVYKARIIVENIAITGAGIRQGNCFVTYANVTSTGSAGTGFMVNGGSAIFENCGATTTNGNALVGYGRGEIIVKAPNTGNTYSGKQYAIQANYGKTFKISGTVTLASTGATASVIYASNSSAIFFEEGSVINASGATMTTGVIYLPNSKANSVATSVTFGKNSTFKIVSRNAVAQKFFWGSNKAGDMNIYIYEGAKLIIEDDVELTTAEQLIAEFRVPSGATVEVLTSLDATPTASNYYHIYDLR